MSGSPVVTQPCLQRDFLGMTVANVCAGKRPCLTPAHIPVMSIPATHNDAEVSPITAISTVTPRWISTGGCMTSYLAGRAAALAAIGTDQLPDEVADDVVRLLRSVS